LFQGKVWGIDEKYSIISSMELPKEKWSKGLKLIRPKVERVLYKGDIDLLLNDSPKLAIVGSRRMSDYGKKVIDKWMPLLVQKGITIVSGFMYGVDQAAHQACLENGGKTIAVLGWGIDMKVSSEDEKLYQKILEVDSLIVSEYEGEMLGNRATFPQRNRIVAGIADAVLVIEAAERSGSLITARLAKQFGKPLMTIPGLVTSKVAEGTNNLIKNGKAMMVTSAEDILREMELANGQMEIGFRETGPSNPIFEALESGEKSADELARILKMSVSKLMEEILTMELDGLIEEKSGKYSKV
jgi:DNA processing protein